MVLLSFHSLRAMPLLKEPLADVVVTFLRVALGFEPAPPHFWGCTGPWPRHCWFFWLVSAPVFPVAAAVCNTAPCRCMSFAIQSQKKLRDRSRVLDIIRKSMLRQNVNLGHADWKLQLWAKCLCVCVSVRGVYLS